MHRFVQGRKTDRPEFGRIYGDPSLVDVNRLTVAAWAALVPLTYAALFPLLRPLNEAPLIIAAGAAGISALLLGKGVVPFPQIALSVTATVWLLLSLARVLPSSWTRYYEPAAALQHWAWALLIPLFVPAFFAMWARYGVFIRRRALSLAVAFYCLSRLTYIVAPIIPGAFSLYGVDNMTIPILMLILIFIFRQRRPIYIDAAIIALALLASPSATNTVILTIAFAIRFSKNFRVVPGLFGAAVLIALLVAPYYATELYKLDPNSGVRAVMWGDALESVGDSFGLGAGFGTEYFKNSFSQIATDWNMSAEGGQSRLLISTHSSFYDVLLRTGIVGSFALLVWLKRYARILRNTGLNDARLFSALCCMVIADLAFNPALVSVNILVGLSMLLATLEWLLENDRHRAKLTLQKLSPAKPPQHA